MSTRNTRVRLALRAAITATAAIPLMALLSPEASAQSAASLRREPLDEIVVTSSLIETPRRQIGTAVSVIGGEEMDLRGYESLADVMRTQPGIGVSNSGGPGKPTALRIRGEEVYRTLLLIDGVKAVDSSAPQVTPAFDSLLTTSDLLRVEVLRGPQGFIYGADAGGVVNVITRTGEGKIGGQLGLELGAFDTRKLDASISGGNDSGDFFVTVTDFATDGFNAKPIDTVLSDDDGADNTTVHTKLGWNVADNLRLQLVVRDIDAATLYDSCYTSTFAEVHDCRGTTEQTTYKVSADHATGSFRNVFGYSGVDIARHDFTTGVSSFATQGEVGRFEYTGSYRPADSLAFVYGLDFQDERVIGDAETQDRDQHGYYFEYQGSFGERFHLALGARHDDNEDFGSHTSARLSGAYVQDLRDARSLKYRASFGTGFRPPSLYEIAYNRGSNAFPPAAGFALVEETSQGYDVGIEYATASGLLLELTYFDQEIDDAIFFDADAFSGYLQAPGVSTSTGVEFAVQAPFGTHWELLTNWTHNDAQTAVNAPRLRRPKNVANFGVLYRSRGDDLRLVANYRVSRDALDAGNARLDDYDVLDVSLSYRLVRNLDLSARIANVLDEKYQEIVGYNTADRTVYAGVGLRF